MTAVLVSIWILHVTALAAPGVQTVLISQLAASGDRRAAIYASAGIATGATLWATAAVLGVDALLRAFPHIRLALQIAGGCYLLYLAVRLFRSPKPDFGGAAPRHSALAGYRMGLLTNLTNPKSALFYGSVFSTAFPPHPAGGLLVASVLMILANALSWHLLLAYVFSRPRIRDAYLRQHARLNRAAGLLVGAFGARVLGLSLLETRSPS